MSYATGTATTPITLLQALVTFLVANGWTQDMSATDGSGWRAHLHKGTVYVHMRAAMNEQPWANGFQAGYGLNLYLSTSFSSGAAWHQQPGNPPYQNGSSTAVLGVSANFASGGAIQNYYFFTDPGNDHVVMVVEKTAGLYVHLGWGPTLTKCGTWTGGAYFFGSTSGFSMNNSSGGFGLTFTAGCPGCQSDIANMQSSFVLVDVDTFTGKWCGNGTVVIATQGYTGRNLSSAVRAPGPTNVATDGNVPLYSSSASNTSDFQDSQTSTIDGRANLLPVTLYAIRDAGQRSLIGSIPFVFSTNGVGQGFSPASEYVVGSNTYKMFPNFAVLKQ